MSITVYAYELHPGVSKATGFANSIEEAVEELRRVRSEIQLEDGVDDMPTSHIYAYDLSRLDLDQLLAVLNEQAELADLVLRGKRVVATEPPGSS